jgi:hypothetical protein
MPEEAGSRWACSMALQGAGPNLTETSSFYHKGDSALILEVIRALNIEFSRRALLELPATALQERALQ